MFCECVGDIAVVVLLIDDVPSYRLVEMVVKVLDHRRMNGRGNEVCDAGRGGGLCVEGIERRQRRSNAMR